MFALSQDFQNATQVLILAPQILIAEFNIIFGVVEIIAAIPTGGSSLY